MTAAALLLATPERGLATGADVPLKQLRQTIWLAKDGLPPSTLGEIEQTPDGVLWLGTFGGLYRFDGVRFDNVPLPRDGVPPGTVKSIAEDASGAAWMLSWSGEAAVRALSFETMVKPPFNYDFVVGSDVGVWIADVPVPCPVVQRGQFTETIWFVTLCLLAAVAAVALLFRWRLLQIRQRLRWKVDAQLGERDRIARELHDTLLQSTQGLILRFQAITNRMSDGDANREKMETALERADEVLTEGRDQVRGLRGSGTSRSTLTDSLRTFGEELAADAGICFRFEMTGVQPVFARDIADEIQRIVCEALVNACRHGQSRSIDLNIANDVLGLTVTVQDDGAGIDSEAANAGMRAAHWGLRGMHERSERIGARLAISVGAVGGTKVELVVPTKCPGSLQ